MEGMFSNSGLSSLASITNTVTFSVTYNDRRIILLSYLSGYYSLYCLNTEGLNIMLLTPVFVYVYPHTTLLYLVDLLSHTHTLFRPSVMLT